MAGMIACGQDDEPSADAASPVADTGDNVETGGETPPPPDTNTAGPVLPPCVYPLTNGTLGHMRVFPDFQWTAAFRGTEPMVGGFDLYSFYCDEAYDRYDTLFFIVSTEWCPYCPGTISYVDALSERLEEEGGLVVYIDIQNRAQRPINSAQAQAHISRYAERNSGIRLGDADNIRPNALAASRFIRAFPTTLAIRRRDMMLITDSSRSNFQLPFVEIAMDPEADWSRPGRPQILPDFGAQCGPEDEEVYEPGNNRPETAPVVGPITVRGGVCDTEPDYYRIDIEGPWRARLDFRHAVGDLDMYIWDEDNDRPLQDERGSPIGSDSARDFEEFDYAGPALLMIYGFRNATGPYTLQISRLEAPSPPAEEPGEEAPGEGSAE